MQLQQALPGPGLRVMGLPGLRPARRRVGKRGAQALIRCQAAGREEAEAAAQGEQLRKAMLAGLGVVLAGLAGASTAEAAKPPPPDPYEELVKIAGTPDTKKLLQSYEASKAVNAGAAAKAKPSAVAKAAPKPSAAASRAPPAKPTQGGTFGSAAPVAAAGAGGERASLLSPCLAERSVLYLRFGASCALAFSCSDAC